MSDIRLFHLNAGKATKLQGDASDLEKPLQTLIELNLETLLGIRFLAAEYSTGKTHAGRIDSLALDENNCPVILEYKRSVGEVLPLPSNGRDVRQPGHWGTGDLELALASQADLDAAKPLILMAYEGRGTAPVQASDAGLGA